MTKTAHSLMLASAIAFLSATPTVAFSGSTDCTPSKPAALHECFHSAEFNVVDGLDVYTRDLSGYGTPRPTNGVREEAPVGASQSNGTPVRASAAPRLDSVTLRAFFYGGAFDAGDGLAVYGGDFSSHGLAASKDGARLARLPQ